MIWTPTGLEFALAAFSIFLGGVVTLIIFRRKRAVERQDKSDDDLAATVSDVKSRVEGLERDIQSRPQAVELAKLGTSMADVKGEMKEMSSEVRRLDEKIDSVTGIIRSVDKEVKLVLQHLLEGKGKPK